MLFYGAMGTLYVDHLKPFQHFTFMYRLSEQAAAATHKLISFKTAHAVVCKIDSEVIGSAECVLYAFVSSHIQFSTASFIL